MFKKLLAGLFAAMMIGCAGLGAVVPTLQNNGCDYPVSYKMDAQSLMVSDEDYYTWGGVQLLLTEPTEGFTFILMDYDVSGVVFGSDVDGDCVADRCIGIQVVDIEQIRTATDPSDIEVTWAGLLDCNVMDKFIEENLGD